MLTTPPASDELEVSLFGPGVGECVVVHLGGGKWMVVDSCVDAVTRQPVALDYLSQLNVDVSADVAVIVVSHWHDDHTAGAAEVVRACSNASVVCSAALRQIEFFELVSSATDLELRAGEGSGVDEMARILDILKQRKSGARHQVTTLGYALANRVVYRSSPASNAPTCTVEALSPSSGTYERGIFAFAAPQLRAAKKRVPNPGPNEASVALHVQFGGVAALLGADLETGSSQAIGWRAVAANACNPTGKAAIVKVPHHGSAGADHEPLWHTLIDASPHAGVTPFNSSKLPKPEDLARLRTRTDSLFHTSPGKPRRVALDPAGERALRGIERRERRATMGHIRFRVSDGGLVVTERFGAAKQVP